MNVRNIGKTAAVALPLLLGHGNAVAQKATQAAQVQSRAVAADTLKAMDNASVDARTFILNKIDSLANAKTDSIVAKRADSLANKKTDVAIDVTVGGAHGLPGVGTKAEAEIERGNNVVNASALYSTSHNKSMMAVDGSYRRAFPTKENPDFKFTIGAGATNTIVRDVPRASDDYGVLSPRITGGVMYKVPLDRQSNPNKYLNSPFFSMQTDVGPAANYKIKAQTHSDDHTFKPGWYLKSKVEIGTGIGHKDPANKPHNQGFLSGVIEGGNHPFLGFFLGGGAKYKF